MTLVAGAAVLLGAQPSNATDTSGSSADPNGREGAKVEGDVPPAPAVAAARPPLPGQLSTKFPIDYWNPEQSVPSHVERDKNPLEFGYFLQDLLEKAEKARRDNDLKAVIRFYRAVAKAVPDNAKGWSKLCEAYELAGDRDRAIRACKYALERPAVVFQDYVRYVRLVLAKEGALTSAEIADLDAVLDHMATQAGTEVPVNQLRCELGVKLKDVKVLESCTKVLARAAAADPRTVVFQWTLAVMKGQRDEARRQIERAKRAGVVLESIQRMERVTSAEGGFNRSVFIMVAGAFALAALAAGMTMALRRRKSMREHPAG